MNRTVLFLLCCFFFAHYAHGAQALSVSHLEIEALANSRDISWWDTLSNYLGIRRMVPIRPKEGTVLKVISSAYASSPYQTDASPCVTAAGTVVRPGTVAANFLPLGTIISIDDKKYIVEDRMNARYDGYYLDIWFPSTSEALEFGRQDLEITILGYGTPGDDIAVDSLEKEVAVEPKKGIWESITSPASKIVELLFTRTYSNPNKYDVDCTK